jgi:hypothetical protein
MKQIKVKMAQGKILERKLEGDLLKIYKKRRG